MKLSQELSKFMICSLSLITLVGFGASNASAKHIHHHYRHHTVRVIHRKHHVIRRHHARKHYVRKHHVIRKAHRNNSVRPKNCPLLWWNRGNDNFARWTDSRLLYNVNQARVHHGLKALPINHIAQRVAEMRNHPVYYAYSHYDDYTKYPTSSGNPSDNWIHGMDTHQSASDEASKLGITNGDCAFSENAADVYQEPEMEYQGEHNTYNTMSTRGSAYAVTDTELNHDMAGGNDNGHRINILDPYANGIGIACYHRDGLTTNVMDFSHGNYSRTNNVSDIQNNPTHVSGVYIGNQRIA